MEPLVINKGQVVGRFASISVMLSGQSMVARTSSNEKQLQDRNWHTEHLNVGNDCSPVCPEKHNYRYLCAWCNYSWVFALSHEELNLVKHHRIEI